MKWLAGLGAVGAALAGCSTKLPAPVACDPTEYLIPVELPPVASTATPSFATLDLASRISTLSAFEQRLLSQQAARKSGDAKHETLSLSGGGPWGAFGASFLDAWNTPAGRMPEFDEVTGVSTGALISTFAFLGGAHTSEIKNIYASLDDAKVYKKRNLLLAVLSKNAQSSLGPLRSLITERIADPGLIERVGLEGAKGRSLYVGMVDLNSGHLYAADLTALAMELNDRNGAPVSAKRRAEVRACYTDLLLASAAVPKEFDPVVFGKTNPRPDEKSTYVMVDGGVRASTFIFEKESAVEKLNVFGASDEATHYVIVNGMFDVCPKETEGGILNIAGRSVSLLINQNGRDALRRIARPSDDKKRCTRYAAAANNAKTYCAFKGTTTDFNQEFLAALVADAKAQWADGDAFRNVGCGG